MHRPAFLLQQLLLPLFSSSVPISDKISFSRRLAAVLCSITLLVEGGEKAEKYKQHYWQETKSLESYMMETRVQ